jgi:hypothetical protein
VPTRRASLRVRTLPFRCREDTTGSAPTLPRAQSRAAAHGRLRDAGHDSGSRGDSGPGSGSCSTGAALAEIARLFTNEWRSGTRHSGGSSLCSSSRASAAPATDWTPASRRIRSFAAATIGADLAIPTWPKEWRDPHRRCGRSHLGESTSGANLLEAAVAGSMRIDMYVQMHHHAWTNLECADLRFARRRDRLRPQTPCAAGCRPLRARRKVRTGRLDLGGCGSLGVTLASSGRLLLLRQCLQPTGIAAVDLGFPAVGEEQVRRVLLGVRQSSRM